MCRKAEQWSADPQAFWKDFKRDKPQASTQFSLEDWTVGLSQLYAPADNVFEGGTHAQHAAYHASMFPPPSDADRAQAQDLNRPFSVGEVHLAIKSLQNGKAAGTDGLPAEFIKYAFPTDDRDMHVLAGDITHALNTVFDGQYPQTWTISAIAPVPKAKSDPRNMDNYRAIAVGNALAKLYSMVLLQRLDKWAEDTGRRAKGQAGFRHGRCAADNIFILQHVLERAKAQNTKVFCAYVDFKKAYDSVDRGLLWQALQSMGVHGQYLDSLKSMYDSVTMRVRIDGRLGRAFQAATGVKQGDPLSPLLFGLFIDRFEQFALQQCAGVGASVSDNILVQSLFYADDLVLMAHSEADIQRLLTCLHDFSTANMLTVSIVKTKVMVAGDTRWAGRLLFGGDTLPVVDSFVYLGVRFHAKCNQRGGIHMNKGTNLSKAKMALGAMRMRCRSMGLHNVHIVSKLFDALVGSVLNYGCEVWGVYHMYDWERRAAWGDKGDCESMHKAFLRSTCSVFPSCPTAVLMNEVGRRPLMHAWCKQAIGWWNRIVTRHGNDLVLQALKDSMGTVRELVAKPYQCWSSCFLSMLVGIDEHLADSVLNCRPIPVVEVLEQLEASWHRQAWGQWLQLPAEAQALRSIPSDTRTGFQSATYRHYFCTGLHDKHDGFTRHLHTPAHIQTVARFRMSSHDLSIVRGRHAQVARHNRTCTLCDTQSREDEMHILECPFYQGVRDAFHGLFPAGFAHGDEASMRSIMNPGLEEGNKWRLLADFLQCCMNRRGKTTTFITHN